MNDLMLVLTPFVILVILAVFGFAGCTTFGEGESPAPDKDKDPDPDPDPDPKPVTPPPVPPVKAAADAYQDVVLVTAGFAAFWPLNESGGTVANVVGTLNPAANGLCLPPGVAGASAYALGQKGVLNHKDSKDFAAELSGTAGWIEVQFQGPLNPVKTVAGFSVELWVKPYQSGGGQTQVVISSHRFDSAAVQQGYEIALVKGPTLPNQVIRARVFDAGQMTEMTVQPLQGDPAEWRHIVLTYEQSATVPVCSLQARIAGSPNIYKDGPHGAKYDAVVSAKPSTLRFGAGHATGQVATNFFSGRIDCVAFYNAVLSQAEIDKHFAAF